MFRKIIDALFIGILFSPLYIFTNTYADSGNVGQIDSFLKSLITAVAGLSGLVATGFFIMGGFRYITSSGNPMHLDRAKRTIIYSGVGLAITIGAFVLSNIVTGMAKSAFGG